MMATAKPRKRSWLRRKIMPPPSKEPGSMDYPAISEAKKARVRRKKVMEDMFK